MQHKFKLAIAAAFILFSVAAKAQHIRVLNSCYMQPKTFTFFEADAYSTPIKNYTIQSYCPQKQYPDFKVDNVGNYEFNDLPVHKGEQWSWFVESGGKTIKKGEIKNGTLEVQLGENQRLTIIISPTLDPNATVSANGF